MEEKFIAAWESNRAAANLMGIRMRPLDVKQAQRILSGTRLSDGFNDLKAKGQLKLSLEALVRTTGAAFCLSGAGPTLLCITQDKNLQEKLAKKLDSITEANWEMIPLHVEFQGAHVIASE